MNIECKTHVLHNLIRDCYISFLLKTQYIAPHIIISYNKFTVKLDFQMGIRIEWVWLCIFL